MIIRLPPMKSNRERNRDLQLIAFRAINDRYNRVADKLIEGGKWSPEVEARWTRMYESFFVRFSREAALSRAEGDDN